MDNAKGNHGQMSGRGGYTTWSAGEREAMAAASPPASPDADQDTFWEHAVCCVVPL